MSDNTYAAAGVSIEEGDRAVELFAPHAKRATRPEVLGGLGGFAGLFKLGDYKAVSYTHLTLPTIYSV